MPEPNWTEELYQGQHHTDALLHQTSLQLAMAWHSSHKNNCPLEVTDDLMQAYVNTRRAIQTRDENGKRFGARAAYFAMQGEVSNMQMADPKTGLASILKFDEPFPNPQ
tara:strand:- start:606 stop:932 length:327 start_codon:yes stop_codon:yes gene_type:complete